MAALFDLIETTMLSIKVESAGLTREPALLKNLERDQSSEQSEATIRQEFEPHCSIAVLLAVLSDVP